LHCAHESDRPAKEAAGIGDANFEARNSTRTGDAKNSRKHAKKVAKA
jgi:hypothetical protein